MPMQQNSPQEYWTVQKKRSIGQSYWTEHFSILREADSLRISVFWAVCVYWMCMKEARTSFIQPTSRCLSVQRWKARLIGSIALI